MRRVTLLLAAVSLAGTLAASSFAAKPKTFLVKLPQKADRAYVVKGDKTHATLSCFAWNAKNGSFWQFCIPSKLLKKYLHAAQAPKRTVPVA